MNRIKEVLEEQGRSQKWLAAQIGKSYNMVNAYVQNTQQPRLEVLNDIAKILDVDVKDLSVRTKPWVHSFRLKRGVSVPSTTTVSKNIAYGLTHSLPSP